MVLSQLPCNKHCCIYVQMKKGQKMKERDFKVLEKNLINEVAKKLSVKTENVELVCDCNGEDFRFEVKKGIVIETINFTEDIIYNILSLDKNENLINLIYYHDDSFFESNSETVIGITTKKTESN